MISTVIEKMENPALAGTATGVFIGISSGDYAMRPVEPHLLDGLVATGNAHSIALLSGLRDGSDYQSFPSGHTTAAFAFASAVDAEWGRLSPGRPRWVVPALYGVADLLPEEKRAQGFGILRVAFNVSVTIGPLIGGFDLPIALLALNASVSVAGPQGRRTLALTDRTA